MSLLVIYCSDGNRRALVIGIRSFSVFNPYPTSTGLQWHNNGANNASDVIPNKNRVREPI